ncbi:MAG: cysteinyl-tRNA synthetase [Patescibacteria group bacterium]|nr:cysteinyl-tRNA synthetase [Patescibacteria group bacterium]
MSDIFLYNTKTRQQEAFVPIHEGGVSIYSCGPTVYHYAHIGNLRAYVFADVLRRMFVQSGFSVKHVINITDVGHLVGDGDMGEDKLETGAKREGKTAWDIAKFYTDAFFVDLDALNIPRDAYLFPRATENIPEQITLIKTLEEKGFTYKTSDGIYFDTSKFPRYTDLAKLDIEGLQSGARIEENTEKKNITDFALWKFSPKETVRHMEWDSPWGKGFPGWHIECSAMSEKYLGKHFDIHTGGIDHIPVHHTNEIAQSEGAHNETYVNYWMHVNFLNDKDGKMAKSSGDFLRLQTLINEKINPLAYRYYLLTTHYRSEISFSFESLRGSQEAYNKLFSWCAHYKETTGTISEKYKADFKRMIGDDVNTPQAIALIWTLMKDYGVSATDKYATILYFDEVLGLGLKNATRLELHVSDEVKKLLEERDKARINKNFAESDRLRNEIANHGFVVKDTPNGQELETK